MENSANTIEHLIERIEQYSKTSIDLYKCHTVYETATLLSFLAVKIILTLTAFMVALLFTVALSLCIGDYMGNTAYGFLMMGCFYVILGMLIYSFRKPLIENKVSNAIIKKYMAKEY